MSTIQRKETRQARARATTIIHHVSERSLNTRSPRPRSERKAPRALTALLKDVKYLLIFGHHLLWFLPAAKPTGLVEANCSFFLATNE